MRPPTVSKKEMMTKFDAEGFLKICGENQGISNPWHPKLKQLIFTAKGKLVPRDQFNSFNLCFTVY